MRHDCGRSILDCNPQKTLRDRFFHRWSLSIFPSARLSMSRRPQYFSYRVALLASISLIVPLGYGIRFAANTWLNDLLGSIAYEIFWIALGAFLFPAVRPVWIAVYVLVATCVLEGLQLWQNPLYLAAKATFLGRLILGNTFTGSDFLAYFAGSFVGWIWIVLLHQRWVK